METNFEHTRGDTFKKIIHLTTPSGDVDITGGTILFTMKIARTDKNHVFQKAFTITNAVWGLAELIITATETSAFSPRNYLYDIQFTDSNGNVKTLVKGNLSITYDIT